MRFTIKARLAVAFAVILILSAASAYMGISSLGTVDEQLTAVVEGPAARSTMTLDMMNLLSVMARAEKNIILEKDEQKKGGYVSSIKEARGKFGESLR